MAGRSVGNIEITVDANTGKLKAQLVKAGEVAGEGAKDAIDDALGEIGGARLQGAITKVRTQIERGLEGITAAINAAIKEGDLARLEEEVEFALEGLNAAIGVGLVDTDLAASVEELNAAFGHVKAEVEPTVSELDLIELREEINVGVSGVDAEVDLKLDKTSAATFKAEAEALANDVSDGISGAGGSGGGFDLGFLDVFSGRMKAIIGGIALIAEPATVALAGLASAGIALVGSASIAAVSGVSALGASIGGLAFVGGSAALALQGVSPAISAVSDEFAAAAEEGRAFNINAEAVQEALRGLAPAAQEFALAAGDIVHQFDAIGDSVQEEVFRGIGAQLSQLADTAIPNLGAALTAAGGSLNIFFSNLLDVVGQIDFSGIFTELQPAVNSLLQAIVEVVNTIEPFLLAAAPAAAELAGWLEAGASALQGFVASGQQTGSLTDFLSGGIESLELWGSLIGNIVQALGSLFSAGQAAGDTLVGMLDRSISGFDDWMNSLEGQNALAEFFQLGIDTVQALAPLVDGLRGAFDNIITPGAVDRLTELGASIGDLLPQIGELIDIIGRTRSLQFLVDMIGLIGDVVDEQAPKLENLADTIGESLADGVEAAGPLFATLGKYLGLAADLVAKLLPPFITITNSIFPVLNGLLETAFPLFQAIVDVIGFLVDITAPLIENFERVIGVMETFASVVGAVLGGIGFMAGDLVGLATSFDDINAKAGDLGQGNIDKVFADAAAAAAAAAAEVPTLGDAVAGLANDYKPATSAAADFREEARFIEQLDVEPMDELRNSVSAFGDILDDSAEKANTLRTALDKLFDPLLSEQESIDQLAQNTDDLNKALEENGATLDVNTEAGRKNREQFRTNIEGFLDYAESAKEVGKSNEEISAGLSILRDDLITQAQKFGLSKEAATAYVDQLGLTPSTIETIVATPGMAEALTDTETLGSDLNGLPDADPTITTPGMDTALTNTGLLKTGLDGVNDTNPTPTITVEGIDDAIADVGNLNNNLNNLDGKTVTTHIQTVLSGNPFFGGALGGYAREGKFNYGGEAGPELAQFQGMRAVLTQPTFVPAGTLLRPLQAAELSDNPGGVGRQVNVTLNVYPTSADPGAVATQVINRVAVLADR